MAVRRRRGAKRPSTPRRWPVGLRLFVWLVRALIIVGAVQFSGIAHHAVDAVHAMEGVALHEGQLSCPYEERGDDCPPGCPDCHCAHVFCALPAAVPELIGIRELGTKVSLPYESVGPPREAPHSLFRPPRSLPPS